MRVTSCLVIVICMLVSDISAQTVSSQGEGRLNTLGDLLQQHHIALTNDALIEALRNRDLEIRWLAAQKLAEDKATDSIPYIIAALRSDRTTSRSKVNIAFALAELDSEEGYRTLSEICIDTKVQPHLRLLASRYLLIFGKQTCLSSVIDVLQMQADDDLRAEALQLISRFAKVAGNDRNKIGEVIANYLVNESPTLRLNAAIALANVGDPAAVPALKAAIEREKEAAVRSQMEDDLRALERKARVR